MYTYATKNTGYHALLKENEHFFAIELSLMEISFVLNVHALKEGAKILRSGVAQCNAQGHE